MPFDGRSNKAKDRGYQLVYALRNLPETHEWDFACVGGKTKCGSHGCALGLYSALWEVKSDDFWFFNEGIGNAAKEFGISFQQADNIFFKATFYGKDRMSHVTPEMVANALEEALNNAV